jgi:hypothetical protein
MKNTEATKYDSSHYGLNIFRQALSYWNRGVVKGLNHDIIRGYTGKLGFRV